MTQPDNRWQAFRVLCQSKKTAWRRECQKKGERWIGGVSRLGNVQKARSGGESGEIRGEARGCMVLSVRSWHCRTVGAHSFIPGGRAAMRA